MRELYEALQQVEADRAAGKPGCTLDELEEYLDDILEETLEKFELYTKHIKTL
ncbi:hypothetical protein NE634_14870 [Lacrimispora saccharolytica]|nr:hypothetical protein [Lacrimispora saccharolytica]